jgi:RNA polymerase sigma factor (sigma-70 family)
MDLIQEGCFGLMRAVKRFDAIHQVRLISFAAPGIRWNMVRVLVEHHRHKCESLDEAIYEEDGEGKTRLDRLVSEDADVDLAALHEELRRLVERLRDREREIIQGRFWRNTTAAEMGRLLNLSQQRILQIEARALYQLRRVVRDDQPFCVL